jgi:hypothetical protein
MRSFIPLRFIQDDILVVFIWKRWRAAAKEYSKERMFPCGSPPLPDDSHAGVILNAVKDLIDCLPSSYVFRH